MVFIYRSGLVSISKLGVPKVEDDSTYPFILPVAEEESCRALTCGTLYLEEIFYR